MPDSGPFPQIYLRNPQSNSHAGTRQDWVNSHRAHGCILTTYQIILNTRVMNGTSPRVARSISQPSKCILVFVATLALIIPGGRSFAFQEKSIKQTTSDITEAHLGRGYDHLKQTRYAASPSELQFT